MGKRQRTNMQYKVGMYGGSLILCIWDTFKISLKHPLCAKSSIYSLAGATRGTALEVKISLDIGHHKTFNKHQN